MARQMSTRELSEERARLTAALLRRQSEVRRTAERPEGTSGPAELQRQQQELEAVAAQLRETTTELERRTAAAADGPVQAVRKMPAPLAEQQQMQTWHHRRTPIGDRTEEERRGMA
ncbi:hypothetical protein ACFXI0_09995 [Kitasatospora indigofera]|uniref:hypothetical protein n=1 Tax=Kitasatospora indigofera TaxID=67307 RepID=UPI0036A9B9F1